MSSEYTQGFLWQRGGDDAPPVAEVIEAAFDYRGNVTLRLAGDRELVGYLYNREAGADEPYLEIFPTAGGEEKISYAEVCGLAFTGKDTAAGKSWETWAKNHAAKNAAEARGEHVGSIDLFPDESE